MDMKKVVQNYLEEQIAFDSALRDKYSASAMDKCIEYITEQARKELNSKSGAIEGEKVFHWAREYFLEVHEVQEAKELMSKVKSPSFKKKLALLNQLEFNFD
jgi:hypothetical protein